jgi:hypothetical protein
MLTQGEQQAYIKRLWTGNCSPEFFKALMVIRRKKNRPAVPTRNCGTTASQQTSTVNRKSTELASESSETATRRPATGAGSTPKQLFKNAKDEQAASGARQLVSPKGGMTYAAV